MTEAQTGSRGTQTTHAARPPLILAADDGTRRRIASIYLNFVRYFLDARDGTPPVQDEPEVL
jgi:hypothetical protein